MKRVFKHLIVVLMFTIVWSSVSFGANDTMSLEKACRALNKDKGKEGYIIGKFPMIHYKTDLVGLADIVTEARDVNIYSRFSTRFELTNTQKRKKYTITLKPVTGSDTTVYYLKEEILKENDADPYWVLKVPVGTYELSKFLCSLTLEIPGYEDFRKPIFDVPVEEIIKKTINFQVAEKQIVYIGDLNTTLITYICLNMVEALYPFGSLKISLEDNLEAAKTALLNTATEEQKQKINEFQFVSALQ